MHNTTNNKTTEIKTISGSELIKQLLFTKANTTLAYSIQRLMI